MDLQLARNIDSSSTALASALQLSCVAALQSCHSTRSTHATARPAQLLCSSFQHTQYHDSSASSMATTLAVYARC
eukprot:12598-Heterococcus_DN1.PRE.1